MKNSPLVTVVLPTYNRAKLLSKSIESVISQTYINWELIIWNDGSLDETDKVINSYKDKRINSYFDDNHGMSYGLNNSIKKSRGEYIAFLDDDDQWLENKLSHQMDLLLDNPGVDLVFGNFLNIDLASGEQGIGFDQNHYSMNLLEIENKSDDTFLITGNFFKCICLSNFIAFDTVVIRKNTVNKVGKFNETLRNSMDFDYWWRLALGGGKMAYTNDVVLKRIKPQGSLSSPGILTYENKIRGLDSCLQETLAKGRNDLVPYLNRSYKRAWQNMIPLYGSKRDFKGVQKSFYQSMKYGVNFGSVRLLFEAIAKPVKMP